VAPVLETLGILIGFVMIVLLLSVYVTAAAQFTQSALRLRGRNLQRGLAQFFEETKNLDRSGAMVVARDECAGSPIVPRDASKKSAKPSRLFGPQRSWLEREELAALLAKHAADLVPRADEIFTRFERTTSRRFSWLMKLVSFAWALLIAFAFQASTPDLFARLSAASGDSESSVAAARDILAGIGEENGKPAPDDAAALATARASMADARSRLDRFDVRFWPNEWAFYYSRNDGVRYGKFLGVLMTAVLLTFGAPFWFQMLQNLVGLRDLLSPPRKKKAEASDDSD